MKQEVAMRTVETRTAGIHWLGHDSFRVDGSRTVYFDPFKIAAGPLADLILVSHEHYDHCSPDDIDRIRGPQTVIVTEKDAARKLVGDVRILKAGESLAVGTLRVEALPAYNIDKRFHTRDKGWLGFVVEMDGRRIYHAGDTDFIPEMAGLRVDVALLPVSGTYVMTASEAAQAALAIRPGVAIPMHYGAIVGGIEDADRFRQALSGKVPVTILPAE
jgi:L-ascorbate metabolism protein UlaG (beta-lactamase superfamily)